MAIEAHDGLDVGELNRPGGVGIRCQGLVHLYKTFEGHDVVALQGVDLTVEPGERVAFLGPSGSGKSTLLTLFGGIQKPSAGRIFLGDEEISRMSERQLTRVRASPGQHDAPGRDPQPAATTPPPARTSASAARASAATPTALLGDAELLRRVGLEAARPTRSSRRCPAASGSAWRSPAASPARPQLLLADEPTSQLSHEDRDHMLELIHGLGNDFGTTILVVTHQPEVAATFPRTVTMRGGRVGMEGRDGAEYVVVGAEGVVHLPAHIAREWPQGTLVRIEPEDDDRLLVSRRVRRRDPQEHLGRVTDRARDLRISASDVYVQHRRTAGPGATSTSTSGPARSPRCPGRPARARPPCSRSPAALIEPTTRLRVVRRPAMWQGDGDPRHEVAFVLQVYGLVPILSARENVAIALRARGVRPAEADERAEAELARFHIGDLGDRQVEELSGGQMQRVAWPAPSRSAPRSCSPTSPPASSTRATASSHGRAARARPPAAPSSWSPPTTRPWSTPPTATTCSTRAG